MKDMAKDFQGKLEIASAATSTEELGNPVYPPARRELARHGISCDGKVARQMTVADYDYYDCIVAMDALNLRNMKRFVGEDPKGKVSRLLDYTSSPHDVADPWYSGDFETTYNDVKKGCKALLEKLREEGKI